MKRFTIRGLLFVLLLSCSAPAWAATTGDQNYDFEVDGVYYHILSTQYATAEVTYLYYDMNSTSNLNENAYSGDIEIPEKVWDDYDANHPNGGSPTLEEYTITAIGPNAFFWCTGLTSLKIPDTVTSIGEYACLGCSGLKTVILGSSVEDIGMEAFFSCRSITEIISFNPEPPAFTGGDTPPTLNGFSAPLYVPAGSKTAYLEANEGNSYSTWNPDATNSCISKIKEFMEVDLTVTEKYLENCYATFYSEKPFYTKYDYSLTNDLQCATASVSDGTLTMNWAYGNNNSSLKPDVVPGGTAVVLKGYYGTHYPIIYEEDDDEGVTVSEAPEDNMLLGSEEETETTGPNGETEGYIFYMLSYSGKNGSVCEDMGFYYGVGCPNGEAFTSKANKAWLAVPDDDSGAKITSFIFSSDDSETTAIRTIDSKSESDAIYNLQGVRVNDTSRKGIYIVGGKKVIKK